MMTLIPHSGLVHLPLALAVLMPLMYALAWLSVRRGWLNQNVWYGVALFAVIQVVASFVAVESGEAAEFLSAAGKKAIELHEEAAEAFMGVWVGLAGVLIASLWLRPFAKKYSWVIDAVVIVLFAVQFYLAFLAGHLGGDLILR